MVKQHVYVVVGLPRAGVPLLLEALEYHRDALEADGLRLPANSADELFRAAVELRREHRAWGLRRKDVEGTWAGVARRTVGKRREASVLGHDLLAGAAPDQIALLVDGLAGCAVHVVVLAGAPDPLAGLVPTELDLGDVLARWQPAVSGSGRVHVLVSDPADLTVAWRRLGELVGFDADALPLPAPRAGVATLDTATLRLLAEGTGSLLDHDDLVDLVEHWAKLVADSGYDVRGDLTTLTPTRAAHPTDPSRASSEARVDVLRDALSDAVTEVARLRAQLAGLQQLSAAARRPRRRSAR
jgi:hypothetical protein